MASDTRDADESWGNFMIGTASCSAGQRADEQEDIFLTGQAEATTPSQRISRDITFARRLAIERPPRIYGFRDNPPSTERTASFSSMSSAESEVRVHSPSARPRIEQPTVVVEGSTVPVASSCHATPGAGRQRELHARAIGTVAPDSARIGQQVQERDLAPLPSPRVRRRSAKTVTENRRNVDDGQRAADFSFIGEVTDNAFLRHDVFILGRRLRYFGHRLEHSTSELDAIIGPGITHGFPLAQYYSNAIYKIMITWAEKCYQRGDTDLKRTLIGYLIESKLTPLINAADRPPVDSEHVESYLTADIVAEELTVAKSSTSSKVDSGFGSSESKVYSYATPKASYSHPDLPQVDAEHAKPYLTYRVPKELTVDKQTMWLRQADSDSSESEEYSYAASYYSQPHLPPVPNEKTAANRAMLSAEDSSFRLEEARRSTTPSLEEPIVMAPLVQASATINSGDLNFAQKRITDKRFLVMVPEFAKMSSLSKVLLNGNQIRSSASIAVLAEIIAASSSTLKMLDLSGNKVGDHGWRCLLPSLSKCSGLESISLSNCNLSAAAIPSLHNITGVWPLIKMVDVSCNDFTDECQKSTAAWTSLVNRVSELNVYSSGIDDLKTSVYTADLTSGSNSNGGRGLSHLPLYVHDPLLNGIYIGPDGGQLRHGPVKIMFPAKCVKKVTWIKWPSLTFFGRSLSFSGHEITMGPGIEIGPSQEFDEPITVVVYDSRISSNHEPIVLTRQSSQDHYTDLSDTAKLNAEGKYLMFTTIHFTKFRCAYCERTTGANVALRRRLRELTSENITVLLNEFDRKQVLVFTAEYLEFIENYQVFLKLRSIPIMYREGEDNEKTFTPSSDFLWTGGPATRYPVVDPAEYEFHVTLNPSSPDVQLIEPIDLMMRYSPVEATHLFVVKKTASRRLQGQARCHYKKKDAPDSKVESMLFYVDIPEKGGHRNQALVVDATGASLFKDLPMKQSSITADTILTPSDEGAEDPWRHRRFSREFYKRIILIDPALLRTVAVSEGMLTDLMAQILQAPQNQDPCTHNTLLLNMVKPNGISAFEQFLSVLKNLGYDELRRDLQGILPIGHHLRGTGESDGAGTVGVQPLAACDPSTRPRGHSSSSPFPMGQA